MTSKVSYVGGLRTVSTHVFSGTEILSDAPLDNHGKGEAFSPTDLVANSLATCILTTMAIKAQTMDIELSGSTAEVTKFMHAEPRRIAKIKVVLHMKGTGDEKARTILERTGHTCPVGRSLHPELEQDIQFQWS